MVAACERNQKKKQMLLESACYNGAEHFDFDDKK